MNVKLEAIDGAVNFHKVSIGDVELYFSYETIVGFYTMGSGFVVSENVWSNTTGKHLTKLCEKKSRIPHADFLKKLAVALHSMGK